jgi:uncharacterized protein (TIGR03083 family)
MNPIDVSTIAPVARDTDARRIALDAYDQLLDLLDRLDARDWDAPTECTGWSVADMVGHIIGAARSCASVRELIRQQSWGLLHRKAFNGNPLDAANALQVREHADLSPPQKIAKLRELAPRSVAGRLRIPAVMRAIRIPQAQTGNTPDGSPPLIHLARLFDVIYTRDVWLHTIDIARATGQEPDLGRAVNHRIVADVVAEWAARHRQPFALTLTGPAGGHYARGSGGERLELDAVEFCRALSGRAEAAGLLATRVYF